MRKLLLIILLMMIPLVYALSECKPVIPSIDIPCRVTSTWIYPNSCSSYSTKIMNDSGEILQTLTLGDFSNTGFCTFNFTINKTGSYAYNISSGDTGNILVENDKMWLLGILLIPLGLSFLFIYWGNTLSKDHEPMKWFMRMLSFIMIFLLFATANIVINLNPGFESLQVIFNIVYIQWIFWSVFALFLVYFIYRIALSMRWKSKEDFEQGLIK